MMNFNCSVKVSYKMRFMHNFKNHFYSSYYIDKYLGYIIVLIHFHLIIEVIQFKRIEHFLN